jgi:hypothetical protein
MRSCPVSHEQMIENMPDDVNELSDAINTYLTQKVMKCTLSKEIKLDRTKNVTQHWWQRRATMMMMIKLLQKRYLCNILHHKQLT